MKRVILILCVLAGLLAACQPAVSSTPAPTQAVLGSLTAAPTPSPTPTTVPTEDPVATALRGREVMVWNGLGGSTSSSFTALVEEFNQTNIWGIHVTVKNLPGSGALTTAMNAALDQGELPQVVLASPDQLALWQSAGAAYADLRDFLDDPHWGMPAEEQAAFLPLFAIPTGDKPLTSLAGLTSLEVLAYNQTWAKALGYSSAPVTFDDFTTQVCKAAESLRLDDTRENDGTGGWIVNTRALVMLSWLTVDGGDPIPASENGNYTFNQDDILLPYTRLWKWFNQNCAWLPRLTTVEDYFSNRQALIYSLPVEALALQERAQIRAESADQWTVLAYPNQNGASSYASPLHYAVIQTNEYTDLASWLVARWLLLPRSQARLAESTLLLPTSSLATAELADFRARHPQWAAAQDLLASARLSPALVSWRKARTVLEDAGVQTFISFTTQDRLPVLLKQLDQTIQEVLAH